MPRLLSIFIGFLFMGLQVSAFMGPTSPRPSPRAVPVSMNVIVDPILVSETSNSISTFASSGMTLAESEAWVQPTAFVLGPFLNFLSFAMVRGLLNFAGVA